MKEYEYDDINKDVTITIFVFEMFNTSNAPNNSASRVLEITN